MRHAGGKPLEAEAVKAAIKDAQERLGTQGRVVVRASGTEPLIRIMAEADDERMVGQVIRDIDSAVKKAAV